MNIDIPIKNLLGNFVMFMPFAYFVFYFKKYRLSKFMLILFVFLVVIEIMQALLRAGFFDVDDIILNALGALLTYWILESKHSRRVR
jgi:glycopeptide antibiotics resistance protein